MIRIPFLLLVFFALMSVCEASEEEVGEILSRLESHPFHPELLCEEIAAIGHDAIPALEKASESENPAIRKAALASIASIKWRITPHCFYAMAMSLEDFTRFGDGKINDSMRSRIDALEKEKDTEKLVNTMITADTPAALTLLETIEKIGVQGEAARIILASVETSHWFYAGVLLARNPEKVFPEFERALQAPEESLRHAAAFGLVIAPREEALEKLLGLLTYKSSLVRLRAAQALGSLGDGRALEDLTDRLENDDDSAVRAEAAWSLGLLENTENAAEELIGGLDDDQRYVKSRCIESLAVAGTDAALEGLSDFALKDGEDSLLRRDAIRAIGQVGTDTALEKLKPFFFRDEEVYSIAPAVTGKLGEKALPFIRKTIEDAKNDDLDTFRKCQAALSAMGNDALPLLLDLLDSNNNRISLIGRTLLYRLTGEDFEYDRKTWEKHLEENPLK